MHPDFSPRQESKNPDTKLEISKTSVNGIFDQKMELMNYGSMELGNYGTV